MRCAILRYVLLTYLLTIHGDPRYDA